MSQDQAGDGATGGNAEDSTKPFSVDRLTQAFAQLLGDDRADSSDATEADSNVEDASTYDPPSGPDEDDDAAGVTPASILEAILFLGHPDDEPLTSRQMASYLRGVSPQEVEMLIEELNRQYTEQSAPYEIVSRGAGYHLTLRDEFRSLGDRFYGKVREAKLTQAAVDLLAIVAYHQPIERERIEKLRGQPSGALLAQLVRRQLLCIQYTNSKPRKRTFATTDRFLALFRLESLADLPSHGDL